MIRFIDSARAPSTATAATAAMSVDMSFWWACAARAHHVVFDRIVDWSENVRIVAWVALYVKKRSLDNWFKMQCIKQKSTLRVSKKYEIVGVVKVPPNIVYFEGSQNNEIAEYLHFRELILKINKDS